MRNQLQYLYSITVFIGVLVTAYLMMNSALIRKVTQRNFETSEYRTEAAVEPALNSLFEFEETLEKFPKPVEMKRVPTQSIRPVKSLNKWPKSHRRQ